MIRRILFALSIVGLSAAMAVEHPSGAIKKEDILRARENLRKHNWARQYLDALKARVEPWTSKVSAAFLQQFVPDTTPGEVLLTPCPSCRQLGKPYLPHGSWDWSPNAPEELRCKNCGTTFPNEKYPENIVVRTEWGKPQTLTFAGGEPFPLFSYKQGRPSFSGNIRAQKVRWISVLARDLAEVYALTGDAKYAIAVRDILLRFAEVYPYWLVHVGYGEYADMDPALAAANINSLPKDESVYPPNRPDRKLHTGYWTAGRSGAVGMEGNFVQNVTIAYDLTYDAATSGQMPVYSAEQRRTIEDHLLQESVKLLTADAAINNKSMTNRSAAGLVGLALGDPHLVRFGMDGFTRSVDEWFLSDGGTPESPAYAIMALGGIIDFAQALRGFTDPVGYADDRGRRFDNFDPYRDTNYHRIWDGMFNTLQGNFRYPPFADSYPTSSLPPKFAEVMADQYPENPQYLSLLKTLLDGEWDKAFTPYAIYYAAPDRAEKAIANVRLPSRLFPDLRLGFMRTGPEGRDSLLLLSASHWGVHHHLDSLNLYYWSQGEELLSDLGYLWDHPEAQMTSRTLAHNTVLIDSKNQIAQERGGEVDYFLDTANVKAMRARSEAYREAPLYERAVTLIEHPGVGSYAVDIFWVEGGETQDYVYHGPNQKWELVSFGPAPKLIKNSGQGVGAWARIKDWFQEDKKASLPIDLGPSLSGSKDDIYDLSRVQTIHNEHNSTYGLRWQLPSSREFTVWHVPSAEESAFIGDGWGQRDSQNKDKDAKIPYVVRRTSGSEKKTFISVMEAHTSAHPIVTRISQFPIEGNPEMVTALQIDTAGGRDYVVAAHKAQSISVSTPDGRLKTNARLGVISVRDGDVKFYAVDAGKISLSVN